MQHEKLAIAWVMVVVVGLLVGLLIVVAALGVARHLRRQKGKGRRSKRPGMEEDVDRDEPSAWRRSSGGDRGDD